MNNPELFSPTKIYDLPDPSHTLLPHLDPSPTHGAHDEMTAYK